MVARAGPPCRNCRAGLAVGWKEKQLREELIYPVARPEPGVPLEIAPGVFWLRMPIPIKGLDFINLWLLTDGPGWTLVDSGLDTPELRAIWAEVTDSLFVGGAKPPTRLIGTHFHPDHLGLAGELCRRFDMPLWMTFGEWSFGRMIWLDARDAVPDQSVAFYARLGFPEAALEAYRKRGFKQYQSAVSPIPDSFRRIAEGERIEIGGRIWQVMVGRGHAPEHACLYCAELGLLISGDQVLPRISPHIGVYPTEPEADPLKHYLDSLPRFRDLPAETLVLPSHGDPFRGLHERVATLERHHRRRLADLLAVCAEPKKVLEVFSSLYRRPIGEREMTLATGEALAHLHYLIGTAAIARELSADGIYRYRQSAPVAEVA